MKVVQVPALGRVMPVTLDVGKERDLFRRHPHPGSRIGSGSCAGSLVAVIVCKQHGVDAVGAQRTQRLQYIAIAIVNQKGTTPILDNAHIDRTVVNTHVVRESGPLFHNTVLYQLVTEPSRRRK